MVFSKIVIKFVTQWQPILSLLTNTWCVYTLTENAA